MKSMPIRTALVVAVLGSAVLAACKPRSPVAYGGVNRIIVAVPDALWDEVGREMERALEPTIFTVRQERTFELTQASPLDRTWAQLRQFKQVLVIGTAEDPWIEPVLRGDSPAELPALVERQGIWARGQVVTAVVLPAGGGSDAVRAMLPELHEHLDRRFRSYVHERMFVSGRNEELSARLRTEAGFGLLLPQVYRWTSEDSAYVFRNDMTSPRDLRRSLLVTWRSGAAEPTPATALAWRDTLSARYYAFRQHTQRDEIESRPVDRGGGRGIEVQGIWSTPPGEWPAAGPFVNRVLVCPAQDRTYFLDAWLYAPTTDKYEYMLQLQTILDSFECEDAPAARTP